MEQKRRDTREGASLGSDSWPSDCMGCSRLQQNQEFPDLVSLVRKLSQQDGRKHGFKPSLSAQPHWVLLLDLEDRDDSTGPY